MPAIVSLTKPATIVPEWEQFKVAIITDMPPDGTVLILIDPVVTTSQP
jgi:hypothetical protein